MQILSALEHDNDISVRRDINIHAGEIGEAVGAEDATSLADSVTSTGTTEASSVVEAANLTKPLLTSATVDLDLLSEEVKDDSGADATPEVKRQKITERRRQLLSQYAGAAIQVAEGMNAISNQFSDRVSVLLTRSASATAETPAYVLVQETGRFVLFETLRGLALSSIQMGVQAARLLNDQKVEVEENNESN